MYMKRHEATSWQILSICCRSHDRHLHVDHGVRPAPKKWQPIRYVLKLVNRYLEPFAEGLWHNEIRDYAKNAERFTWRKRTFFGGVYQCVVVEHKN